MFKVKSNDGTTIAYKKVGSGPNIIIVGGALADHLSYELLAVELAKNFTVYYYDRRGRGQSAASKTHNISSEIEDIKSLTSTSDKPFIFYGHSSGAALVLHAISKKVNPLALILVDPPYSSNTHPEIQTKRHAEETNIIKEFVASGHKMEAVKYFLKDFFLSEEDLMAYLQSSEAQQLIENANTLPVDYEALGNGIVPVELLKSVKIPTLLLTSEEGMLIAKEMSSNISKCTIQKLKNPSNVAPPEDIANFILKFSKAL